MPVIIGRNDTGKSSILHALAVFFDKRKLEKFDFHIGALQDENIEIEVSFTDLDNDTKSQLERKRLVSSSGKLIIKKAYDQKLRLKSILCKVYDFTVQDFQNLWSKKEKDLNELCQKYNLGFTKAGRSVTNENKIEELVHYAEKMVFLRVMCGSSPTKTP